VTVFLATPPRDLFKARQVSIKDKSSAAGIPKSWGLGHIR
jgi:hypothetical protein